MNTPKKNQSGTSNKWMYLLLLIVVVSSIGYLFLDQNEEAAPKTNEDSTITEKIEVRKDSLIEIVPNEQTEFFSKEEGKALLWYAMVNDSIIFYKNKGKHPVTGEDLLPVTEEIIKKYQETKEPMKEVAKVDPRKYKVNEMKIIKKKEKPVVVEKKVKRETIWNTSLENTKDKDEVSLFVFNENDQIDQALTKRLKEEFLKRDYFITDAIIYPSEITPEIASHLKTSNVEYFEGNLKKYTDFICIGIVKYSYKENAYRNDLLDCIMNIEYFIYDAATAQQMFSEKDKLIGSDQTKKGARREAIKKFIL